MLPSKRDEWDDQFQSFIALGNNVQYSSLGSMTKPNDFHFYKKGVTTSLQNIFFSLILTREKTTFFPPLIRNRIRTSKNKHYQLTS